VRPVRDWSFARVLLVSGAWILLCLLVAVAYLLFQFREFISASSGSAGIGAVTFGVNVLTLGIPLLPPIVLLMAWLITRRNASARPDA
jgi:hypothetical protein